MTMVTPPFPTQEAFAAVVGSRFRVLGLGEGVSEWDLIEATSHPRHQPGRGEKYSLLFRGPVQGAVGQGLRELEHPTLGRLALFVVPVVSPSPTERHYEAVINREVVVG